MSERLVGDGLVPLNPSPSPIRTHMDNNMGVKHHVLGTRMVEDHPEKRYRLSDRLNWPERAWNRSRRLASAAGLAGCRRGPASNR
jgi:hypothetical protein